MNTIIIYSSKYGCTADCAEYLKSGLSDSAKLTDIDKTNSNAIALESYDTVIFGSSIYVGAISKKMRKFCKENVELLSKKRVGIFLCCGFPEQAKEYLTTNFPSTLLKSAIVIKDFGGEARIDKMKFIDKSIMKTVMKGNHEALKISHENIDAFIKELNK
ncbi:flavodoxin domain-containing protein [Konateibacter massiliensis]|uniref:flavodoxin domain-containing protein n=1 Tax=Konateibacter massiliensis TaxID=2002841 RepID=UPI000C15A90A|nr:flavodoxin domain-containing protein [Konateibacter massiliensis]